MKGLVAILSIAIYGGLVSAQADPYQQCGGDYLFH